MGLKGYRLWDMGQLDSTCGAPRLEVPARRGEVQRRGAARVAGQRVRRGAQQRGDHQRVAPRVRFSGFRV
jgi:hypothetical protein